MKNIFLFMIFLFFIYILICFCVIKLKKTKILSWAKFPNLKLKKQGVFFCSYSTHRFKINNTKIMFVENVLYLKTKERLIVVFNIKDVKTVEDYLYFTGMGNVKILFDCENIFRYFSIDVKSQKFDLNHIKQMAIVDLLNCGFDENFSKIIKKYIKIIENILNIHIFKEKITVKPNIYSLPFVLTYRLNNKIKRVNIR